MASAWKIDRPNKRGQIRSTVLFRHPETGRTITDGTYPSKIAAERVRELHVRLNEPDFINPKLGREPFRKYAEIWYASRGSMDSNKKVRSYLDSQLLPAFGHVALNDVDRHRVQAWIDDLVDPEDPDARVYSPESIRSWYNTLSTIMKMAAVDKHIPVSTIGRGLVKLPSSERDTRTFLTLDQLERLLEAAARAIPHYYAMIKLTAETGMRWGEVAALEERHVSLDKPSVLVEQSLKLSRIQGWVIGRPKGGRSRRIGLEDDTTEVLRSHLAERKPSSVQLRDRSHMLIFTTPDGRPLDRNNFRRDVWRPFVDSQEWLPSGLRFHDLRHTHISILLDLGTPATDVAERVGHASTKMTTDNYGHSMPHRDDRALARLSAAKAARVAAKAAPAAPEPRHLRLLPSDDDTTE